MTADIQYFFDWDITKLESANQVGNYQKVVTKVFWTLLGSDEFGNQAPLYGETDLPIEEISFNSTGKFVPYNELTKDDVEDMLEDALGEDEIARLTDNLKIQLQQLQEVQTAIEPPPWLTKA